MHSPIIRRVEKDGSRTQGDLYETFAALSRGDVDHFPALRAHQADIWHIFTVQVAVLAIESAGATAPPHDARTWRDMLHGLTPQWPDGEPWHMIVNDLSKPALLQPATDATAFTATSTTPDDLDVVVTGRNHDIKGGAIAHAHDDDWLFALVTLQTSEGSMGAGSQPVSRINGGYASRATMRLVPQSGDSASFLRDVAILLRTRRETPTSNTPTILWTLPWTGKPEQTLDALALDPLYIEICRRVRMTKSDGAIEARRATPPRAPLVRSERGITRCPWTPVVLSDKGFKSFSPGPNSDRRVPAALMDRTRTERPLLAQVHPEDEPGGEIRISGMRRGQGATERFDTYRITMPPGEPAAAMTDLEANLAISTAAYETAWSKLRIALMGAMQGAQERIRFDDTRSSSWADDAQGRFDEAAPTENNALDPTTLRRDHADAARQVFAERVGLLPGAGTPRGIAVAARSGGMLEGMLGKFIKGDTNDQ